MVYIFFVQSGTMMTFENEISIMQSVADLKRKIFEKCHIPIERQVLLISGGEPLDSSKNLCSYMAGTDTNPIYLFSTNFDVGKLDGAKYVQDDEELRKRLIDARCLPISVNTVKTRTLVAQDFASAAKDQLEFCENLVHEQHLQQQGWFAVIANLDDITVEFRKRWEIFQSMYEEFIADRATYDNFLLSFEADKKTLQKIPVLATLLPSNAMEESKSEIASNVSDLECDKEISLYDWISSDNKISLDDIYELCKSRLSKFETEIMPSLKTRITETLLSAETPERKEIEGLEKRLCDLDDLVRKVKAYVECQTTMARSFLQHKQSVTNIKDNSVLPELSVSHMHQLTLILETHEKLMEDRNRIIKAKFELSKSLCFRIGWVQLIEGKLWELDNLLVYFHEHLQRLRKHLEVFQQLHIAPIIYMNALVEVVRRRLFSQLFLVWASDLACQQLTIYNEEVTRRKEFNSLFDGHFLSAIFPGMSDIPPTFATEAPTMFDAHLPNVSTEDVEKLRKLLPEFIDNLTIPDMSHVANFFAGKSSGKEKEDKVDDIFRGMEDKLIQAVSDVGLASQFDQNMLKTSSESCLVSAPALSVPKDDKGCESETDTEEFEKVGQSPMELGFPQGAFSATDSKVTEKIDASTITEVRNPVYPKKPPRFFRPTQSFETDSTPRTLSITSMNESFTNLKNSSLDSIDEMSSLKVFTNNTDSCFNSHYNESKSRDHSNLQSSSSTSIHLLDSTSLSTLPKANALFQNQSCALSGLMLSRSMSISPQSPRDVVCQETSSPNTGMQSDFSTDEYYIDESMPSSVGTGNSQGSEFVRQLDTANIVIAMLQENLQISRLEHEKLQNIVVNIGGLAKLATSKLRTDLNNFKVQFETESRSLSQQYGDLGSSWETLLIEVDKNEQEIVRSMRQECSEHKDQYQYNLMEKEELIKIFDRNNRKLENDLKLASVKVESLEALLDKQNADTTSKIETLNKQLQQKELDHRAELDNIKSRFKLITMEKSPSLTSLEKEKSSDYGFDSTLFLQMTENFELDKEKAVAQERDRWERILEDKVRERCELLSQEITRRISEDKDVQIDTLRRREKDLNLKIVKYQTTIDQLTDREINSESGLGEEFQNIVPRLKEETLEKSTADLTKSEMGTGQPNTLNFNGSNIGAIVLVYWDVVYKNYKIYQHSKQLYFLHFDSLANLGLSVVKGQPNKTRCIGEVIDKELCACVKETNSLNIPKGTRFFLVKVKPVNSMPECLDKASCLLLDDGSTATDSLCATSEQPHDVISSIVEQRLTQESAIIDSIEQATIAADDSEQLNSDSTLRQEPSSVEVETGHLFGKRNNSESEEIELLKRDNQHLKDQLASITGENRALMTTSVAVYEGKLDATTSPLEAFPATSDMCRSEIISTRPHRLSIDSCKTGDVVLLLWNAIHENFKILQESKHTYFPHSDCFEKLGLSITEGKPNKMYCLGEVVDREYCQTRKSENRYKVPKGAKFFRVKLKPISASHREAADLSQSVCLPKQASTMSTSYSVATTFEPLIEETQLQDNVSEIPSIGTQSGCIDNLRDCPCTSETSEIPSSEGRRLAYLPAQNPAEIANEKSFAEDSGIQEVFPGLGDIDGFEDDSCNRAIEQATYSTNWFEEMFRSMFSK